MPTTSTEKDPQVKVHNHMGTQEGTTSAKRKRTVSSAKDHEPTTKDDKHNQRSQRATKWDSNAKGLALKSASQIT